MINFIPMVQLLRILLFTACLICLGSEQLFSQKDLDQRVFKYFTTGLSKSIWFEKDFGVPLDSAYFRRLNHLNGAERFGHHLGVGVQFEPKNDFGFQYGFSLELITRKISVPVIPLSEYHSYEGSDWVIFGDYDRYVFKHKYVVLRTPFGINVKLKEWESKKQIRVSQLLSPTLYLISMRMEKMIDNEEIIYQQNEVLRDSNTRLFSLASQTQVRLHSSEKKKFNWFVGAQFGVDISDFSERNQKHRSILIDGIAGVSKSL